MPPIPFRPRDKVPAIARFVGQRPAVWIDDLHAPPFAKRAWAELWYTLVTVPLTFAAAAFTVAGLGNGLKRAVATSDGAGQISLIGLPVNS